MKLEKRTLEEVVHNLLTRVLILEAKVIGDETEVSHLRQRVRELEKENAFLKEIRDERAEEAGKLWVEINRLRAFEALAKARGFSPEGLEQVGQEDQS
jgi:hypothetical protein